ncbi:two component regulator with propeller domain [Bacteroides zoogleoformans]|nr:two component regulator with propeller domain [Bacteroides zoogleoformans]
MHRYFLYLCMTLLSFVMPCRICGQKSDYGLFRNIYLGAETSVIGCFLQDTQGLMWIGTEKGLYSYDGYSARPHFTPGEQSNTHIYCGVVVDSTYRYNANWAYSIFEDNEERLWIATCLGGIFVVDKLSSPTFVTRTINKNLVYHGLL